MSVKITLSQGGGFVVERDGVVSFVGDFESLVVRLKEIFSEKVLVEDKSSLKEDLHGNNPTTDASKIRGRAGEVGD